MPIGWLDQRSRRDCCLPDGSRAHCLLFPTWPTHTLVWYLNEQVHQIHPFRDYPPKSLPRSAGTSRAHWECQYDPQVMAKAEAIDLPPNLRIHVATTGHLTALKVLSRDDVTRGQDLVDL